MTLARTIKRRERRKRAKRRPSSGTGNQFVTPAWLMRDIAANMQHTSALSLKLFREYDARRHK